MDLRPVGERGGIGNTRTASFGQRTSLSLHRPASIGRRTKLLLATFHSDTSYLTFAIVVNLGNILVAANFGGEGVMEFLRNNSLRTLLVLLLAMLGLGAASCDKGSNPPDQPHDESKPHKH